MQPRRQPRPPPQPIPPPVVRFSAPLLLADSVVKAKAQRDPATTEAVIRTNPIGAPSSVEQEPSDAPVRIERGRLVIDSLDAWREFAAEAIEVALREGARSSIEVLATVMRRALPRTPWPPRYDSPLFPQWKSMLKDTSELLHFDPQPEPDTSSPPRLRRIQ